MTLQVLMFRAERPVEERTIRSVHLSAFPTDREGRLVDELRRAGRLTFSLVALFGEQIVGHIALSPVPVGQGTTGLVWLRLRSCQPFRSAGLALL